MEWSGVNSLAETARTFCKHQRLQAIPNGEIHRRPATARSTPIATDATPRHAHLSNAIQFDAKRVMQAREAFPFGLPPQKGLHMSSR